MKCVFDIFSVNLLASSHVYNFDNSTCRVFIKLFMSFPLKKMLVSSANSTQNNLSGTLEVIYIEYE